MYLISEGKFTGDNFLVYKHKTKKMYSKPTSKQ